LGFSFLSGRLSEDDRLELLYEERLLSEDSDLFLLCFLVFLLLLFLRLNLIKKYLLDLSLSEEDEEDEEDEL
jgi:hypothetical protein